MQNRRTLQSFGEMVTSLQTCGVLHLRAFLVAVLLALLWQMLLPYNCTEISITRGGSRINTFSQNPFQVYAQFLGQWPIDHL